MRLPQKGLPYPVLDEFSKIVWKKDPRFLSHFSLQTGKWAFTTEKENTILVCHLSGPQRRPIMLGVNVDL